LVVLLVTILSRPVLQVPPQVLQELLAMPLELLVPPQVPLVMPLVLLLMPLELQVLLGKVAPGKVVQGKVQLQEKVERVLAKQVVVRVWVTVNPALGVTTELRDSRESVGHCVGRYSTTSFS